MFKYVTDTEDDEADIVVDHVKMCFMCLDVGIISYGLCSAQSQSDAGPLWVSCLLPCDPVCCTLHPVLPLYKVTSVIF